MMNQIRDLEDAEVQSFAYRFWMLFRLCIGPSRWMRRRISLICLTASLANTKLLSQLVDISKNVMPHEKK